MAQYRIIANGIELEPDDDLSISLNFQIEDILNISSRATNWSRSFTLPGTSTNNVFFKHIYDVNIDTGNFNPSKKIPTIVMAGDAIIFKGDMQLQEVNVIFGNVTYEVSVFGILSNFINDIKDLYVTDIDYSEWNHIRNRENIIDSMTYKVIKNGAPIQYVGPGNGYVYPYIIYGQNSYFSNINIYDIYPAPYVMPILKKIVYNAGYNLKSTWADSDYANKLIFPFVSDKLQLTDKQYDDYGVSIGVDSASTYVAATSQRTLGSGWDTRTNLPGWTRESGTVDDTSGEITFKDNLGQFTNGAFVCQNQGYYNIQFNGKCVLRYIRVDGSGNINYDEGSGVFELEYRLLLVKAATGQTIFLDGIPNGESTDITPSTGAHPSIWYDDEAAVDMALAASNVLMAPGDYVYVFYGFRYPGDIHWVGDGGFDDDIEAQMMFKQVLGSDFSKLIIKPTSNTDMGNSLVDMQQCLPQNYKQEDFIGDLTKMFNLIITEDQDDPKTLIIEPRDVYYSTHNKVLEWDYIWDEENGYKETPMSELDATEYSFTYNNDNDYFNEQYTNSTKKVYGEFKINVGNDFSDKVNATKVSLAPTPDASQFLGGKVAPWFATKEDEGYRGKKVKNRILFYGGMIPATNSYLIIQDYPGPAPADFTTLYQYPYCGMWDHPTDPHYDLGFGSTDKIYWDSNVFPSLNLFEQYHKTTVNNIINRNARLLEAKFKLTPADIAVFDFRNIVFFLGAYWRVNEIKDFDAANPGKLTTVILYKILDAYASGDKQVVLPLNNYSCPIDIVRKRVGKKIVHTSKSGQEISENCCSALGGDWQNGVCYAGNYAQPGVGSVKDINFATGISNVPYSEAEGPISQMKDGNTLNRPGVKVHGSGAYVHKDADITVLAIGNDISIQPQAKNMLIIGEGGTADKENAIDLNGTIINESGEITPNFNMLQGPRDAVRNLAPYNSYWNMWKSGTDAVRDIDFTSEINLFQGGRDSV